MARKTSAGLLLYRRCTELEVFLVHPGGPFWSRKDAGAWSIPKGEFADAEEPLQAAKREFMEETGFTISGEFRDLDPLKQPGGKIIYAWAIEADCDPAQIRSNLFSLEWPPKSGKMQHYPEVDRAAWFNISEARKKILVGQVGFIEQLIAALGTIESESHGRSLPLNR
jgi:predicted NUDIX family NTP pyrophosphohydrolase